MLNAEKKETAIVMIVRMVVGVKKNSEPLVHKLHHSKQRRAKEFLSLKHTGLCAAAAFVRLLHFLGFVCATADTCLRNEGL